MYTGLSDGTRVSSKLKSVSATPIECPRLVLTYYQEIKSLPGMSSLSVFLKTMTIVLLQILEAGMNNVGEWGEYTIIECTPPLCYPEVRL
jgi:hypothetical protein